MPRKDTVLSLHKRTSELLNNRNRKLTIKQIANDTGLNVQWLSALGRGISKNPSVNCVQALYEYLTKTELQV